MKARSLRELPALARAMAEGRLRADLEERQLAREAQARQALAAREAALIKDADALFRQAIGPVKRLQHKSVAALGLPKAKPVARMRERDERAVLHESLSDGIDAGTLLETDEHLSYRGEGIGPDVLRKLRQGHWSVQGQIDLHGLRTGEARDALSAFLREAQRDALRCLRVVHGKGLGSPGKTPVLKNLVRRWLMQKRDVLAYVQAKPADGGAGALLVLLRSGA
jgi:DNA-nicking Smr family endonuclease